MSFMEFTVPCVAALLACIGFSFLYNIHGKNVIISSLCGMVAWAVYLITTLFTDSMCMPFFTSGLAIGVYSEIAAYIFKAPITVFLIPGIIPLVPGLRIYRTLGACLSGNVMGFAGGLIDTLKIGGAIALGLIFISSLVRLLRTAVFKIKIKNDK